MVGVWSYSLKSLIEMAGLGDGLECERLGNEQATWLLYSCKGMRKWSGRHL